MRAKPPQTGQAPCGLLNEKSLGSISAMVKPDTGQANLEEKRMLSDEWRVASGEWAYSPSRYSLFRRAARIRKLHHRQPVAKLERGLEAFGEPAAISGLTTMRSTTTSMSCLSFLSSVGASAIS